MVIESWLQTSLHALPKIWFKDILSTTVFQIHKHAHHIKREIVLVHYENLVINLGVNKHISILIGKNINITTNFFPNQPVSCDGSGLHSSLYNLIPDKNYFCKSVAYKRENVFLAFKKFQKLVKYIYSGCKIKLFEQHCQNDEWSKY